MALSFHSVLKCPVCGHEKLMEIPYDEQLKTFTCPGCHSMIESPKDHCCIFCAYGSHECLIQQGWQMLEEKRRNETQKK